MTHSVSVERQNLRIKNITLYYNLKRIKNNVKAKTQSNIDYCGMIRMGVDPFPFCIVSFG